MEQDDGQVITPLVPPTPPVNEASLKRTRPAVVTVIAIVLLLMMPYKLYEAIGYWQMLSHADMYYARYPQLVPIVTVNLILRLIASPWVILVSIALLRMRRWARKGMIISLIAITGIGIISQTIGLVVGKLSLAFAVTTILVNGFWLFLYILFAVLLLMPSVRRAFDEE